MKPYAPYNIFFKKSQAFYLNFFKLKEKTPENRVSIPFRSLLHNEFTSKIGEELWSYTTLACCGYAFDKQGSCVLHIDGFYTVKREVRDTHRKTTNQSKGKYTITYFFAVVKGFCKIS